MERRPGELRPLRCQRRAIEQPVPPHPPPPCDAQRRPALTTRRADGAVRLWQGGTEVLAAVHGAPPPRRVRAAPTGRAGPVDVAAKEEAPARATVAVTWCGGGAPGVHERAFEQQLRHIFAAVIRADKFPRTLIRIVVQEVHDAGGLLPCAVNAVCLALMEAGVPLSACAAAVRCGIAEGGGVVLDPEAAEEATLAALCDFTFALAADAEPTLLGCRCIGPHTDEQQQAAASAAASAAAQVRAFYRGAPEN